MDTTEITIRLINNDDIEHIRKIAENNFTLGEIPSIYMIEYIIEIEGGYVAIHNNIVIGYIFYLYHDSDINKNESVPTIASIAVSKDYQNMGIGKFLIRSVIKDNTSYLHVRTDNIIAYNMYYKVGFKVIKVLPDYYTEFTNIPGDAFYMRYG